MLASRTYSQIMKKSTCAELRGACDVEITGVTPEEMGQNCRAHVMKMVEQKDAAHLEAIAAMKQLSQEEQQAWSQEFAAGFDSLPDAS